MVLHYLLKNLNGALNVSILRYPDNASAVVVGSYARVSKLEVNPLENPLKP